MSKREMGLFLLAVALSAACARAPEPGAADPPAGASAPAAQARSADVVGAANAVLATLDASQRAAALFPWGSEQRTNWSNLPTGIFERNGVRLGDLAPTQRDAVHALLRSALSEEGYRKVVDIMAGDEVLRTADGGAGGRLTFGADEYYLAFVGTPSAARPWMMMFGGHHLAINATFAGGSSALTPSLPATQPATFNLNGRLVRPLGDEYDKAFALLGTLDASQRQEAVLGYQIRDLALGPGQDGKTIAPEGIRASRLSATQQEMLVDLAGEWVRILNEPGAAARLAEIRRNLPDTWFAWSGGTEKGRAAYFRIQGPTVHIEYAPQGRETGTDQGVDHVHTIYRDPSNDYGARLAGK